MTNRGDRFVSIQPERRDVGGPVSQLQNQSRRTQTGSFLDYVISRCEVFSAHDGRHTESSGASRTVPGHWVVRSVLFLGLPA